MKRLTKHLLKVFVLLLALSITNCQKEDDSLNSRQQTSKQKSTTKTVTGKNVPLVIDFIKSKTNERMEILLDDSNSPEGMNRSHEENLTLTSTLTEQIKQVTNSDGKSNYTFKLIEEVTKEGTYFLNLIVKDYKDTFYMYIIKYVPSADWLSRYKHQGNFYSYTGQIYFYSDEGLYLAKVDMLNGSSTSVNRHPCDNDNNNGDGGGGDGGTGDTGDTGSSGDDDPYEDCDIYWEDIDGSDTWDEYPSDGDNIAEVVLVIDCSGANFSANTSSFNDMLRHPCGPPEVCYTDAGDPCPCNPSGTGCDDADGGGGSGDGDGNGDENPDLGILPDLTLSMQCDELNKLLTNPDIKDKLEQMKADLFSFPNVIRERGFSLTANASGDLTAGPVSNSTNSTGSYDYQMQANRPGGAHTHPEKGLHPMFSFADIQVLNSFWQTYNNPDEPLSASVPVHVLVTQQGVYAIKIDELALFAIFNGSLTNDRLEQLKLSLKRAYNRQIDPVTGAYGTSFDYQLEFLKFLQDNSVGLSFFKADDDLTKWTKKELNESGNDILPVKCK